MNYSHLSIDEREQILVLKSHGYSFRYIATELNRSHTTICREYVRNAKYGTEYSANKAQKRYEKRCKKQRMKAPLKSPEILLEVRNRLRSGDSPESISNELRLDLGLTIHHETIYRYIYHKSNRKEHLEQYLTLKRKRRLIRGNRTPKCLSRIAHAISIEQRRPEVLLRLQQGHWETDLMVGPQGSKPVLLVNTERKTRAVKISKIPNKTAEVTKRNMIRLLKRFNPLSITGDNGLENAQHQEISQTLDTDFYFCHPYTSWEKGSVENRIGVIRRYIPKGSELNNYSNREINLIEKRLNNKRMKCLGWITPAQAMRKEGYMI
jgi:IS30 family transposase